MVKKKRIFFVFCLLTLVLILISGGIAFFDNQEQQENELHVFMEGYATNPALSQMIEFSKLDKKTPKIIAWHRFQNRKNIIDLSEYNATEVALEPQEGRWSDVTRRVLIKTYELMDNNPDLKLVLHANLMHLGTTVMPFINSISQQKIKRIHLYEDGYGSLFKYVKEYAPDPTLNKDEVINNFNNNQQQNPFSIFYFSSLYPVTYHIFHYKEAMEQEDLIPLTTYINKHALVENIDFDDLRETLTDTQKNLIYRLAGFDYNYYYNLFHDKKTIVFVMGYLNVKVKEEAIVLDKLMNNELDVLKNAQDYQWFYKTHPSFGDWRSRKYMSEHYPHLTAIDSKLPYELFVLSDLKPTYTFGIGSSLFFSLNKEDVLLYLKRHHEDYYDEILVKQNRLYPDRVFSIKDLIQ